MVLNPTELAVWKADGEMKRFPVGSFTLLDGDWPFCSD